MSVNDNVDELAPKVARWTGLDLGEIFSIDNAGLFRKHGLQVFIDIATDFYNRVYSDYEDEWFRKLFRIKKEAAIMNLYEFFVQRFGGPPVYSEKRGYPKLIGQHDKFKIPVKGAERWMYHMNLTLNNNSDLDADSRRILKNFFTFSAYFIVARTMEDPIPTTPITEKQAALPEKPKEDLKQEEKETVAAGNEKEETIKQKKDDLKAEETVNKPKEEDDLKPGEKKRERTNPADALKPEQRAFLEKEKEELVVLIDRMTTADRSDLTIEKKLAKLVDGQKIQGA